MKLKDLVIAPYIRDTDYAVRKPFFLGERSLLDFIIFYVQEGTFEIQVNGLVYLLKEGELCLFQPGDVHTIKGLSDTINPYVHLDFFYNPLRTSSFVTRPGQLDLTSYASFMQPRLDDCEDLHIPFKLETPHTVKLRDLVFKIIECWRSQTYLGTIEANQLANEFLTLLLKSYARLQHGVTSPRPFLNWITSYFAFRFSEPINVGDMAGRAGLSPSRFTVLFKQQFNMTPYQYLLKLRIEHAQELIKEGASLKKASEYCGFSDVHHFSKTFKAATGMSPGYFRETLQAQPHHFAAGPSTVGTCEKSH